MSDLPVQCKNPLSQGEMVCQELNSDYDGFKRWVAIYPIIDERLKKKYPGFKYKIVDFELDVKLIDVFFGEEDKKRSKEYLITSDIELLRLLAHINIDAQKFEAPSKNDYPL